MPNDIEIKILAEDGEELKSVIELAQGSSEVNHRVAPKPQIVDPITAVLIFGGVAAVVKIAADLFDKFRGGVVIDLNQNPPTIKRSRELPAGWAVIMARDGSVKIEVRDAPKDSIERLLSTIITGAFESATKVASKAAEIFGKNKVEVEPQG